MKLIDQSSSKDGYDNDNNDDDDEETISQICVLN